MRETTDFAKYGGEPVPMVDMTVTRSPQVHKLDSAMSVLTSLLIDLEHELRDGNESPPSGLSGALLPPPQTHSLKAISKERTQAESLKSEQLDTALDVLTQQLAELERELRMPTSVALPPAVSQTEPPVEGMVDEPGGSRQRGRPKDRPQPASRAAGSVAGPPPPSRVPEAMPLKQLEKAASKALTSRTSPPRPVHRTERLLQDFMAKREAAQLSQAKAEDFTDSSDPSRAQENGSKPAARNKNSPSVPLKALRPGSSAMAGPTVPPKRASASGSASMRRNSPSARGVSGGSLPAADPSLASIDAAGRGDLSEPSKEPEEPEQVSQSLPVSEPAKVAKQPDMETARLFVVKPRQEASPFSRPSALAKETVNLSDSDPFLGKVSPRSTPQLTPVGHHPTPILSAVPIASLGRVLGHSGGYHTSRSLPPAHGTSPRLVMHSSGRQAMSPLRSTMPLQSVLTPVAFAGQPLMPVQAIPQHLFQQQFAFSVTPSATSGATSPPPPVHQERRPLDRSQGISPRMAQPEKQGTVGAPPALMPSGGAMPQALGCCGTAPAGYFRSQSAQRVAPQPRSATPQPGAASTPDVSPVPHSFPSVVSSYPMARSSTSITSIHSSFFLSHGATGGFPFQHQPSVPAIRYRADVMDAMDLQMANGLAQLDYATASRLMIRRTMPSRYEIDGRGVSLKWSNPARTGQPPVLLACEDNVPDSEMPLSAYLNQAGHVAASLSGQRADQPKISRVPKEQRLTFGDDEPLLKTNNIKNIDTIGNERCESMRLAVEQAKLREEAAEVYEAWLHRQPPSHPVVSMVPGAPGIPSTMPAVHAGASAAFAPGRAANSPVPQRG